MSYENYVARQWEKLAVECEWHEGSPEYMCPECAADKDAYESDAYKRDLEDRLL